MANRKFLIESIMGLAQKLGANPNKFMGTKQNINFLGTGDKGMKGTTFSGKINDDFLELGFTQNDLVKIIEQDAGYVTAGKLNDVQLNTMYNNLLKIDETFNPPPGPMNVIDLKTGTRDLNKEGLESLRTEQMSFTDKIGEGIRGLKTKIKAPFNVRSAVDDIEKVEKKAAEADFTRTGAANFGDSVQAEGARRAVIRQLLLKDPDFFMLPPEVAESISLSKDLGRGGSNFPDPLIVFRNIGNFTKQELDQIDEVIQQSPFDNIDIISRRVFDFIRKIRPDGFRQAFRSGKSVKGIMNLINKKFGKDTMKVADEIDRPASAKLKDEFKSFNERNRPLTQDEFDDYAEEVGDNIDAYDLPQTVGERDKILKDIEDYKQYMFQQYKMGKLDPKPGDPGRKEFLERKLEEVNMTGDKRLITSDELDELAAMGSDEIPDNYKQLTRGMRGVVPDDYNQLVNIPLERLTPGIIRVKYPGITDELAELIGNDTNLQRKAEAIAALEQALALRGAGKSADETIEILKGEPKTKMSKGGLARILEM